MASTLGYVDASTLGVTAFNVGMMQANAFGQKQEAKVAELARHVETWLEDGPAVVGLNEIHPTIAMMLEMLLALRVDVGIATLDSNSLPAFLPCLPALPS